MDSLKKLSQLRLFGHFARGLVFLAFFTANVSDVPAVIVFNDAENTEAPPDDPGWENVGVHGRAGLVYLGNRWAITANHLADQSSVSFLGREFSVDPDSKVVLTNPPGIGLSEETDLRLIRLQEAPDLPAMVIAPGTPEVGTDVVLIGRGRNREETLTLWEVETFGQDTLWTEVTTPPFDETGYFWTTTQTKRWGTNTIADDSDLIPMNDDLNHNVISSLEGEDVISIITRFEEDVDVATEFESHATWGDSGGAVFFKQDDQWLLSGIMLAVTVNEGQPDDTAVFDNFTVSADLSFYRDQILDVITDPPLQAGDSNQDLAFDQLDIIQVLTGAKYLAGLPATWGEGDWDGAPGGTQGDPPAGNGLFDQFDIIASSQHGLYLAGPYAATQQDDEEQSNSRASHSQTAAIVYDVSNGNVSVELPTGMELSTLLVESSSGIFTTDEALNLGGSFDVDSNQSIFKATLGGSFGSTDFGMIAPPGLNHDFLMSDLSVSGSLAGGGLLSDSQVVYRTIPEPSTLMLLAIALLSLIGKARLSREWRLF